MTEGQVDYIAHLLKEAKEKQYNKPIVFIGAGMSVTGGIPSAAKIAEEILAEYKDNPKITQLSENERTYANLMSCLTTAERNTLLNHYIDKAQVNVGYIYLAHLIKEGYIDYVLTVNFDNLILRAMAMYNMFPPTYDLSILKDLTTDRIEKQSVTYLHGTHRGLWMLNTDTELKKISKICTPFLNKIADRRTWIVLGYSGDDKVLDHIADLGSFTNDLYWVTHKDKEPGKRVQERLLDQDNSHSYLVKGYDADSFMLKLHSEVGLKTPDILDTPFTSLKNTINSIVDISDEHKNIKERLEIVKRQINDATKRYEEGITPKGYTKKKKDIDLLRKEIIKYTTEESFEENADRIEEIRIEVEEINDKGLNEELAELYNDWGLTISDLADRSNDASIYKRIFEKYEKAIKLSPNKGKSFYNWAYSLLQLGKITKDKNIKQEGLKKALIADGLGGGSYNVACGYALLKSKNYALEYLEKSLYEQDVSVKEIENDSDWDSLRSDPDFIALIKEYEDKEKKSK